MVTAEEVRRACREMNQAYARMGHANEDFIDAAILDYNAKVTRYEALLLTYKQQAA